MTPKIPQIFVGGPFSSAMQSGPNGISFDSRLAAAFSAVHSAVRDSGAVLMSAHVADHYGRHFLEERMVLRDNEWARTCDLYLAILPLDPRGTPYRTDGTYVETGLAIAYGRRVLLVIEEPDNLQHSYYVRNLGQAPGVRIIEWSEFFAAPAQYIKAECLEVPQVGPELQLKRAERIQTTDPDFALSCLQARTSPEEIFVRGVSFVVFPSVFSPSVSHSPDYLSASWSIVRGASVLDLGCGCGILGILALLDGAGSLVAVDQNPEAVANTAYNVSRLKLSDRATTLQGRGYDAVPTSAKFDVILLSPPFWDRPAESALSSACYDKDHAFLLESLRGVRTHLRPDGRAFMIFSDQGDVTTLMKGIDEGGLVIQEMRLFRPSMPGGHIRLFLALSVRQRHRVALGLLT